MIKIDLKDNIQIRISQDCYLDNPREDDTGSHFFCFHKKYQIGDFHNYNTDNFLSFEHFRKELIKNYNIAVILPVFMLDHSGQTVNTKPFSYQWDSGQVGFIFIEKETLLKTYNKKRLTKKIINQTIETLNYEIKLYDAFLNNDFYGYVIEQKSVCPHCQETKTIYIDSCSGFLGSDYKKNGMIDHFPIHIKDMINPL